MDIRMIALGDSVMWGQGLRSEEKFLSLFYEQLTGRSWQVDTGDDLPDLYARSGAVIDKEPETTPQRIHGIMPKQARHEVPWSHPTVREQVASVPADAARDADLVVVDGGANDFSLSSKLFSLEILTKEFGPRRQVEAEFESIFGDRMSDLLDDVLERFPTATVAVTGYFPILSQRSLLVRMPSFFIINYLALGPVGYVAGSAGGLATLATLQLLFKRAKRQAAYFHESQLRMLSRTVAEKSAETGRRVVFVHPRFSKYNAIAAYRNTRERFVFEPNTPDDQQAWIQDVQRAAVEDDHRLLTTLIFNIEPQRGDHPVLGARRRACDTVYVPGRSGGSNWTCRIAPVGHPTVEGNQRYAEALGRAWDRARELSVRERFGPLTDHATGPLSLREALDRYALPADKGIWLCGQLVEVDAMEVSIITSRAHLAGTDDRVYLRLGPDLEWQLNDDILQHDWHNDFERGNRDTFGIDPALEGRAFHLGEVSELTLRTIPRLDPAGDWIPASITFYVNGWMVYQASIQENVTPSEPWTAPDYPRRDTA